MSEVKIYRAISTQEDEDGKSGGEVFAIGDGVSFTVVENGTGVWWSKNGKDLRDVVELELHPKGEGVWVEGVTAERMYRLINLAILDLDLEKEADEWKLLGVIQDQLNRQLLAQLPTGETASKEETGSSGGLTQCPRPNCDVYFRTYDDIMAHIFHAHPSQPAKVEIELTEEEAREIKRNFPPTSIESPSAFVRLMRKLASRIPDQLTPPLEPKEPPRGSVVKLGSLMAVRTSEGEAEDWYLVFAGNRSTWRLLLEYCPNPEIIYDPTRVGGEK